MIDYTSIEKKWQTKWSDAKLFENDVSTSKPYMVTAAFPYVNAPQHIGHLRTYGTADVLARYKRMRGYNVLFPMAFHATGTPVLAFAKRIRENDEELKKELRIFHIPEDDIAKMTDPLFIAMYFAEEIEKGMHAAGYSIDWRRKFISIDKNFSKFVEWQFKLLNEKGLLVQGKHPVGWCLNENNAVGMHDTKHDVEPEIESETAVKFKVDGEDTYVLCATYRPETIHGVTNLFVDEKANYVRCSINNSVESYYMSESSVKTLSYQLDLKVLDTVNGSEMLKKKCINPATNASIPIFPGFAVKKDVGTGIVMSVPAHAPFDYAAVERLRATGYNVGEINPIIVLELKDSESTSGDSVTIPALTYIELVGGTVDSDDQTLEKATKMEYKEEFHRGVMTIQGYEGVSEQEARDRMKESMIKDGSAIEIYTLANEKTVYCRCGSNVVVRLVDNQWFINYGNNEWKEKTKEAFSHISVLPEKSRGAFVSALDWINMRAAERAQGLGTPFPFDKTHIIESLSDSTVYMSFYTYSNYLGDIDSNKLTPEFFDYVLLGNGSPDEVSKKTGIEYDTIKKCRESFAYWYTETSRHSSPDLIFNHLTMYLFNHVALLNKENWPKQIVVNGTVLSEGEKMSKSLGNIVPLIDGFKKHGVDPLRFVVVAGADLFSDSEFNDDAVNGVKDRFEMLYNACVDSNSMDTGELKPIDYWLYSKLNRKIKTVTSAMEKLELREASTELLYNTIIELKKYKNRGGNNGIVLKDYLSKIVLMLQPIAPHISEELWNILGNDSFSSVEKWPDPEESMISDSVEAGEELIDSTIADARQVMTLMSKKGVKVKSVKVIVADDWKRTVNNSISEYRDVGKAIGSVDDAHKEEASKYAALIAKRMNEVKKSRLSQEEEYSTLTNSKKDLENVLGITVEIENEHDSSSTRKTRALPEKPSIELVS